MKRKGKRRLLEGNFIYPDTQIFLILQPLSVSTSLSSRDHSRVKRGFFKSIGRGIRNIGKQIFGPNRDNWSVPNG
uniref:Ovule protein n=1 Tax=Caenorhabditis tropicalis TaxID=1561998 RepID=A0A1I7ULT4_9PELO